MDGECKDASRLKQFQLSPWYFGIRVDKQLEQTTKVYNLIIAKYHGESSKVRWAKLLAQVVIDRLQVQAHS